MHKSLSLRQFYRRRARAKKPLPAPRHAHTAGGRNISGLWEWFERIVLMATLVSIGLGTWAFLIDYEDRKQARAVNAATLEEIKASQIARELERKVNAATLAEIEEGRKARADEAIARAWSLLTTPATGNSGKREALEYLAAQGVSLTGVDLSCAKMGGGWDAEKKTCETRVDLAGLTLKAPAGQGVDLNGAHLEGAELWGAHLEGAELLGAHLEGAWLEGAHLQGAMLWRAHLEEARLWRAHLEEAELEGAHLHGAELWHARLERAWLEGAHLEGADLWRAHLEGAGLEGAHLAGAHLSAAIFTDAKYLDTADFTNAWAWADKPPIGLPASIPVTLCVYQEDMNRFTRPDPCIPPG